MKRFVAAILTLVSLCWAIDAGARFPRGTPTASNLNLLQENIFGLTGSAWQTPSGYYAPGVGSPAVSTADYYHLNGMSWARFYDLTATACGSAGASIAAANGRYLFVTAPDHPGGNYNFNGGYDFRIGFSNDPGVLPSTLRNIYSGAVTAAAQIASFTGTISGTTLTVASISGYLTFDNHATLTGAGVTANTSITAQLTGTEGGNGTYTVNNSQSVGPVAMTAVQTNYSIYQNPFFVCNPDDASFPFYLYAEGSASGIQHEEGVIKSADLITWTSPQPTHITPTFGSWSSYQRPVRDGANSWHSTGFEVGYFLNGNVFARSKWISTDGLKWSPASTTINSCLPTSAQSPAGSTSCAGTNVLAVGAEAAPDTVTIGATAWQIGKFDTFTGGVRVGSQWVGRAPIDANFNNLNSPAQVNVSAAYGGVYPGPGYLQAASAFIEDGIAHYWGLTGFFPSSSLFGLVDAATYANGGGLWQQGLDYYTEIIDSSAAATAAPIGVKATCASSVASLTWFNALPQQTYRLYRGTTAGTQATLVGDFTGTSATDSGMTLNAVTYYKLVYLQSGVEQKNRVVSTWCSSDSAFVNAHYTRASAGGADMTTCNRTMINAFDAWLVSNSLSNNLLFATMPDFCVAKSGSVITKIFDMGTTRLPRGGDYTPLTSGTTYSATGISSKPAWLNAANTDGGYYGGGPQGLNNIRRKTQITVFAAYQKPGTAQASAFVINQFGARMMLTHTAGTPGAVNFLLADATQQKTATATLSSATAFNSMAGTFDGTTAIAYGNAVAGSGQTGLVIPSPNLNPPDVLTGDVGFASLIPVLMSGTDSGLYNSSTASYGGANQALYNGRAQMVFDKALSGAQITSLDALVR
jgi:hypothetical protein